MISATLVAACGSDDTDTKAKANSGGALQITSEAELTAGTEGEAYEVTLEAQGGTVSEFGYRWSLYSGTLPKGLFLARRGQSGTISGVPESNGDYEFTIRVEDDGRVKAKKAFKLHVEVPPVGLNIRTTVLPSGGTQQVYNAQVMGAGGSGEGYKWKVAAGALPEGLKLKAEGTPNSELSGTPTSKGFYTFSVQLTDSEGAVTARAFNLQIQDNNDPIGIATEELPDGLKDRPYVAEVAVSGGTGTGYRWSVIGELPSGLELVEATGPLARITGRPNESGNYNFKLRVTDSEGDSAEKTFSPFFGEPPPQLYIATYRLPDATVGTLYQTVIKASGGVDGGFKWALTDAPADLLVLAETEERETTLSWAMGDVALPATLNPDGTGTHTFTITVTDSAGESNSFELKLKVRPEAGPLQVTISQATETLTVGTPANITVQASGGNDAFYGWALGNAPAGLSIAPSTTAPKTAVISGYPEALVDAQTVTVTVYDADNHHTSGTFVLTVNDTSSPLSVDTNTLNWDGCLPSAPVVMASGGTGNNYTWQVDPSSRAVPAGLRLIPVGNGVRLTGVAPGDYNFSLTVRDPMTAGGGRNHRQVSQRFVGTVPARNARWLVMRSTVWGKTSYQDREGLVLVDICDPGAATGHNIASTAGHPGLSTNPAGVEPISGATVDDDSVQVSADGSRVVFIADLEVASRDDVYVMELPSETIDAAAAGAPLAVHRVNQRVSSDGDVTDVRISPDGQHVIYRADLISDNGYDAFLADISDVENIPVPVLLSQGRRSTGDVTGAFLWSDGSDKVSFRGDLDSSAEELWVASIDNGVVSTAKLPFNISSSSSLSDTIHWVGDRLLFSGHPQGTQDNRIYAWAVGTPGIVQLSEDDVSVRMDTGLSDDLGAYSSWPWDVSADGNTLFYTPSLPGAMYLQDLSALTDTALTVNPTELAGVNMARASFSPNDRFIAVMADESGVARLKIVDLSHANAVTEPTDQPTEISDDKKLWAKWSSDSSKLAFLSRGERALGVLSDIGAHNDVVMLSNSGVGTFKGYHWAPNGKLLYGSATKQAVSSYRYYAFASGLQAGQFWHADLRGSRSTGFTLVSGDSTTLFVSGAPEMYSRLHKVSVTDLTSDPFSAVSTTSPLYHPPEIGSRSTSTYGLNSAGSRR